MTDRSSENTREGTAFLRDALFYPLLPKERVRSEWWSSASAQRRGSARFHIGREGSAALAEDFSRKTVIGAAMSHAHARTDADAKNSYYVPTNTAFVCGDIKPNRLGPGRGYSGSGNDGRSAKLYPFRRTSPREELHHRSHRAVKTVPSRNVARPRETADLPATFAADVFSFTLSADSRFHRKPWTAACSTGSAALLRSHWPISPAHQVRRRFDRAWRAERRDRALAEDNYFKARN